MHVRKNSIMPDYGIILFKLSYLNVRISATYRAEFENKSIKRSP